MKRTAGMALILSVSLLAPAALDAQGIGGRLRQRLKDAVAGEKKETAQAETAQGNKSNFFSEEVLEITEPTIKGLINGLDLEIRLLTEFEALLGTYRSPEDYARCTQGVSTSPDGLKAAEPLMNLPEGATAVDMQRVSEQVNARMQALFAKTCGPDPADWPQNKRQEKIAEIRMKANAAMAPVRSPNPPAPEPEQISGPWAPADVPECVEPRQEGLTERQRAILEERIAAYCKYKKMKGSEQFWQPGDGSNLAVDNERIYPGTGKHTWLFTADEIIELDKYCVEVTLRVGKITMLMDAIYIKGRK